MIGTEGFYGERLTEAREARGLSVAQFAEKMELTKQMVNRYERGTSAPAPATFETICAVLQFPRQFFLRPPTPPSVGAVFYRSLKSATRQMRDRAERMYGWFRQLTGLVSQFVELPAQNVPNLNLPSDPARITDEMVDDAAAQVRRHWRLGDGIISNVVLLLENHGIITTRYTFGADKLDAFSNWDDQATRPFVVLGADKESQVRSRFDAAHELAHVVLHRGVPKDLLTLPEAFNRIEEQAHRFARAFLLPTATFGEEYVPSSLDVMLNLKAKWRISLGVIIVRATELGLLTPEQNQRLWINRARRGWNRREPFDDEWEPESPVLVRRSLELLIDEGVLTASTIAKSLALSLRDIETIAGIPLGTLQTDGGEPIEEPELRLLRQKGKRPTED
jgi:Zn-dependent peptidase ImmA (M78 family)/transcriptional regulator with XRE-family HTH domain